MKTAAVKSRAADACFIFRLYGIVTVKTSGDRDPLG